MCTKKKIFAGILAGVLLGASAVTGAVKFADLKDTEELAENNRTILDVNEETYAEDEARRAVIDEYISENGAAENNFEAMLLALEASVDNPIEYNDVLYNYEYLRRVYKLTDEQLDYIAGLIADGRDAMTVMDICYFWLDTNEDISIIENIYEIKDNYETSKFENAFNYITNDKCGVMTEEDVDAYIAKGAAIGDIQMANKLCRRGVLTIFEILDRYLAGESFAALSAEVNGIPADTLPARALKRAPAKAFADTAAIEPAELIKESNTAESAELIEETETAESTEELAASDTIKAELLSRVADIPLAECYEPAEYGQTLDERLEEAEMNIEREITEDLRRRGIYKQITRDEAAAYFTKEEADNE